MKYKHGPKIGPVEAYVMRLKKARPDLPDHITPDLERKYLARLAPWFARLEETRQRHDRGEIKLKPEEAVLRRRGVGFAYTTMTDAEGHAAGSLYTMLSAKVCSIVHDFWKGMSPKGRCALELEDALQEGYLLFLNVLSAFDPARGVPLLAWVMRDLPSVVRLYMERIVEENVEGWDHDSRGDGPADTAHDVESQLDFDKWARTVTNGDTALEAVWNALREG